MIPQKVITMLDRVSTGTSQPLPVEGVRKASVFMTTADITNVESAALTLQVSSDGTNWATSNLLISNTTNASNGELVRVGEISTDVDETITAALDLENGTPKYIRFFVAGDHDGTATVKVVLEYY